MTRALVLAAALLALGCEVTRAIELTLPEGIAREDVLLELAVYVAATPNITCEALELGVIDGSQILPARVLVANVEETANVGSVPRGERRLVVANAFDVESAVLVAKGCVELAARQNRGVTLPLLPTVEARFVVDVTVVARVDQGEVSYEIYDDDLDLTAEQNVVLSMENPARPGVFIDAPLRLLVSRDEELVREVILEGTSGRINAAELGIEEPGFYRVELRPRWSVAPLVLVVGAFVVEPLALPSLTGPVGAELTEVSGAPAVITRLGDTVTFSPLDGSAPTEVVVDETLPYVGQAPDRGALFAQAGVGLVLAPSTGGAGVSIAGAPAGNYQYPVLASAGCPDDEGNFVIARVGALFTFVDLLDLDNNVITVSDLGTLPILFGPSACIQEVAGGETRVGITRTNAFGLLVPTAVSGERFEAGLPFAEVVLLTPTTLSTTLALGRDSTGAALMATPDFEGVSISAYVADLDEQLLVRQREALVIPVAPLALAGGELDGALDVALSHLGGLRARVDVGRGEARVVLPITCDEPPAEVTAPAPCQLQVLDVDNDGRDEIVVLRSVGANIAVDVISLDP